MREHCNHLHKQPDADRLAAAWRHFVGWNTVSPFPVTAPLPGRRQEELRILAHLYEPLSNDNSAGVATGIWRKNG